jgi:hypothetical protein
MKIITDIRILQGRGYFRIEVKTVEAEKKIISQDSQTKICSSELVITGEESKWTRIQVTSDIPVHPN